MKIDYDFKEDLLKLAWADAEKVMAKAGSRAINEVGAVAVTRGRAHIGAAGFRDGYFPWQKSFVSEYFPRSGKDSLRAGVRVRHKVGIASVFETGATTKPRDRPLMWLPLLKNLPSTWKRGGVRSGPKNFRGKLYSVNRPGRAPLLVGKPPGAKENVPLFVGIKRAKMPKLFKLNAIIKAAAARLDEFYRKNLKAS